MFRPLASRLLTTKCAGIAAVRAQSVQTGNATMAQRFSTAAPKFPERGIGGGGHPNVLQIEGSFKKNWLRDPSAYPIIVITVGAVLFAGYKVFVVDATSPEVHFGKKERGTINYVENNRDSSRIRLFKEPHGHAPKVQDA